MLIEQACNALRTGKVLNLQYDGFMRRVEVHAVGYTKAGVAIMRAWQISGGSVSNERVGWKLMHIGEALGAVVSDDDSAAPRVGHRHGDPAMVQIVCQL